MKRIDIIQPTTYRHIVFADGKDTRVLAADIRQFIKDAEDLESALRYCEKYGFDGHNITDQYMHAEYRWEKVLYPILEGKNVLLRKKGYDDKPRYILGQGYRAFEADFNALMNLEDVETTHENTLRG